MGMQPYARATGRRTLCPLLCAASWQLRAIARRGRYAVALPLVVQRLPRGLSRPRTTGRRVAPDSRPRAERDFQSEVYESETCCMSYHANLLHLCRVCWEAGRNHSDYQLHAIHKHGADARDNQLIRCACNCRTPTISARTAPPVNKCDCPGVKYSKTPRGYGTPLQRKIPDRDAPIRGKDGNLYVPQRLPI